MFQISGMVSFNALFILMYLNGNNFLLMANGKAGEDGDNKNKVYNHGTIIRTGIACKNITLYKSLLNSAWL